ILTLLRQWAQAMSPWFLPHTADDLSFFALMACTPWQSIQTGAWMFPSASNLPWMLLANAACSLVWHLEQVLGTLARKTGELGSLGARISCSPWQSEQTAALSFPDAISLPCTDSW